MKGGTSDLLTLDIILFRLLTFINDFDISF